MAHTPSSDPNRLLIVEDDALLRDAIGNLLRGEGYVVDEAATGSEALRRISENTYNTVILDLVLPEPALQGTDVLEHIKSVQPHLPVIAFSGKASNNLVLKTIELGVDSFLLKYLTDLDILLDIVDKCVHKDKLTNNISKYLSEEDDYFVIKGITSDMHIYVMQYVMYFEAYLWLFKNIKVRLSLYSDGHDVKVRFSSAISQEQLFHLFREYLSFTEHGLPAGNLFEKQVNQQDQALLTRQLTEQIQHFTTSISQAFYLFTEKRRESARTASGEYALNISKIIKGLHLQRRDYAYEQLRQEADAVIGKASALLLQHDIIPAGHTLMDFCEKHSLDDVYARILDLLHQYDQTANNHLRGNCAAEEYDRQLDLILNAFIFEVIPAVDACPKAQRA